VSRPPTPQSGRYPAATVNTVLRVPKAWRSSSSCQRFQPRIVGLVEHHDALHLRVQALVQERIESDLEDSHRIRLAIFRSGLQHLRDERILHLFKGRLEQVGPARKVVVERTSGDRGLAGDLLG
jgi:hypothetical protein